MLMCIIHSGIPTQVVGGCEAESSLCGLKQMAALVADERTGKGRYHMVPPDQIFARHLGRYLALVRTIREDYFSYFLCYLFFFIKIYVFVVNICFLSAGLNHRGSPEAILSSEVSSKESMM